MRKESPCPCPAHLQVSFSLTGHHHLKCELEVGAAEPVLAKEPSGSTEDLSAMGTGQTLMRGFPQHCPIEPKAWSGALWQLLRWEHDLPPCSDTKAVTYIYKLKSRIYEPWNILPKPLNCQVELFWAVTQKIVY